MWLERKKLGVYLIVSAVALAGCGGSSNQTDSGRDAASFDARQTSDAADRGDGAITDADLDLSDAQIVDILHAVNTGEIQEAMLVADHGSRSDVMAFANLMIAEHMTAESMLTSAASMAAVGSEDSDVRTMLMATVSSQVATLGTETGPAFDGDYVAFQIADHRTVLDLIDARLLPSATNAGIRTQVQDARSMVAEHLSAAMALASDGGVADGGSADGGVRDAGDASTDGG
jgi:putative membrane protein